MKRIPRIPIEELRSDTDRILRQVREEAAEYLVTIDGEVVAELRPVETAPAPEPEEEVDPELEAQIQAELAEWAEIGGRLEARRISPISAVEAVRQQRR